MKQGQADFLISHVEHLESQTKAARDIATDIHGQITADRLLRLLGAVRFLVVNHEGDDDAWKDENMSVLLDALGFERPT